MKTHSCPVCGAVFDLEDLSIVALFGLHLYLIHNWTMEAITEYTKVFTKKEGKDAEK